MDVANCLAFNNFKKFYNTDPRSSSFATFAICSNSHNLSSDGSTFMDPYLSWSPLWLHLLCPRKSDPDPLTWIRIFHQVRQLYHVHNLSIPYHATSLVVNPIVWIHTYSGSAPYGSTHFSWERHTRIYLLGSDSFTRFASFAMHTIWAFPITQPPLWWIYKYWSVLIVYLDLPLMAPPTVPKKVRSGSTRLGLICYHLAITSDLLLQSINLTYIETLNSFNFMLTTHIWISKC